MDSSVNGASTASGFESLCESAFSTSGRTESASLLARTDTLYSHIVFFLHNLCVWVNMLFKQCPKICGFPSLWEVFHKANAVVSCC